ncbi:ThuA domain-containing protein [Roseimaritima ulvae]|uniref:Trehalose utilization n=1 Tax=Roseimaritima ulvae TaxID=980254 RepID=A0A5B9R9M2_9BACT|nr:ThuA domain-containing protein [Roseimaritima ulvae]QEG43533.1 Trehalose utilization [Roseimaritima ulvae]
MSPLRLLPALGLSSVLLLGMGVAFAQDPADPWQQKKAKLFKPLSDAVQAAIETAVPPRSSVKAKQPRRVLVFYRCEGFVHRSIPHANLAVQMMGRKTDAFTADLADTYDVFTPENLQQYDCILLNNTTHMQFPKAEQEAAFLDFIAQGKGLAGFHAASDNFGKHPKCRAMVGGQFAGHPWGAGGTWAFKLDDPQHVLNQAFDGKGFWHSDEIYQYNPDTYEGPQVLRLLVSLDMAKQEVAKRINDGPREVPVSWIRTAGKGRVFYTNFGHREDTFENPVILQHMLDGIQYALGDLEADATPTADAPTKQPAAAPEKP